MNATISSIEADSSVEMTWDEAVAQNERINGKAAELARLLIEMRDRKGWKALGFKSWTAYLSSDMLKFSRQYLSEMVRAAPVNERLQVAGITANHSVANALATFPDELQVPIMRTTLSRYPEATESRVKRVGAVMTQMTTSGHVESAPGTTNAVEAALNLEDEEAGKRQQAYKQTAVPVIGASALVFDVRNEKATLRFGSAEMLDALKEAQRCDYPVYVMIQRTSKRPQFTPVVDAMARFGRTSTRLPVGQEEIAS